MTCKICGQPALGRICPECEQQIEFRSAKYVTRTRNNGLTIASRANKNTALQGGTKLNIQALGYHA